MEPKKRSMGAGERDEFLRAAWRALVAGELDGRRLVFVDEMGANISLAPLYAWSRRGERACGSAPRNWGKNVSHAAVEHHGGGHRAVPGGRGFHDQGGLRGLPGARLGADLASRAGRGGGQPRGAQGGSGARARRGAGVRAAVPAALLAGLLAHRGGLLEAQGAGCARPRRGPERRSWRRWGERSTRSRRGTCGAGSPTAATRWALNRRENRCEGWDARARLADVFTADCEEFVY